MLGAEGVITLEEELDENYEPTSEEVKEYAEWLGMDLEKDVDLFWIAREGLKAPLPESWKPCQTAEGDIFYFNYQTGESKWDHPCDEHYKQLFEKKKAEKEGKDNAGSSASPSPVSESKKAGKKKEKGKKITLSGSKTPPSVSPSAREGSETTRSIPSTAGPLSFPASKELKPLMPMSSAIVANLSKRQGPLPALTAIPKKAGALAGPLSLSPPADASRTPGGKMTPSSSDKKKTPLSPPSRGTASEDSSPSPPSAAALRRDPAIALLSREANRDFLDETVQDLERRRHEALGLPAALLGGLSDSNSSAAGYMSHPLTETETETETDRDRTGGENEGETDAIGRMLAQIRRQGKEERKKKRQERREKRARNKQAASAARGETNADDVQSSVSAGSGMEKRKVGEGENERGEEDSLLKQERKKQPGGQVDESPFARSAEATPMHPTGNEKVVPERQQQASSSPSASPSPAAAFASLLGVSSETSPPSRVPPPSLRTSFGTSGNKSSNTLLERDGTATSLGTSGREKKKEGERKTSFSLRGKEDKDRDRESERDTPGFAAASEPSTPGVRILQDRQGEGQKRMVSFKQEEEEEEEAHKAQMQKVQTEHEEAVKAMRDKVRKETEERRAKTRKEAEPKLQEEAKAYKFSKIQEMKKEIDAEFAKQKEEKAKEMEAEALKKVDTSAERLKLEKEVLKTLREKAKKKVEAEKKSSWGEEQATAEREKEEKKNRQEEDRLRRANAPSVSIQTEEDGFPSSQGKLPPAVSAEEETARKAEVEAKIRADVETWADYRETALWEAMEEELRSQLMPLREELFNESGTTEANITQAGASVMSEKDQKSSSPVRLSVGEKEDLQEGVRRLEEILRSLKRREETRTEARNDASRGASAVSGSGFAAESPRASSSARELSPSSAVTPAAIEVQGGKTTSKSQAQRVPPLKFQIPPTGTSSHKETSTSAADGHHTHTRTPLSARHPLESVREEEEEEVPPLGGRGNSERDEFSPLSSAFPTYRPSPDATSANRSASESVNFPLALRVAEKSATELRESAGDSLTYTQTATSPNTAGPLPSRSESFPQTLQLTETLSAPLAEDSAHAPVNAPSLSLSERRERVRLLRSRLYAERDKWKQEALGILEAETPTAEGNREQREPDGEAEARISSLRQRKLLLDLQIDALNAEIRDIRRELQSCHQTSPQSHRDPNPPDGSLTTRSVAWDVPLSSSRSPLTAPSLSATANSQLQMLDSRTSRGAPPALSFVSPSGDKMSALHLGGLDSGRFTGSTYSATPGSQSRLARWAAMGAMEGDPWGLQLGVSTPFSGRTPTSLSAPPRRGLTGSFVPSSLSPSMISKGAAKADKQLAWLENFALERENGGLSRRILT
uniref:WW domain-containing protein n=1 Tax=Chromera velia CCMP2878 TaxID=1169474 RepID=A0A0G4I5T8_9ALVE|eukprot:Cvel_68.t1-p1 / transcript=Cvel_68.t1 / gene=Cvel_68 / organism=Chromera_velia_CCMP2878 / gene_product=Centrosomal protein of 164 kDa, putative / transcript_product=Centrosomal protein of 164 kDa, putative / location=Cvel_scaffold6:118357-126825(+) / protein_length=1372 / sequence_SO=supercontig / SO=protein_coding / is_pseudo=false